MKPNYAESDHYHYVLIWIVYFDLILNAHFLIGALFVAVMITVSWILTQKIYMKARSVHYLSELGPTVSRSTITWKCRVHSNKVRNDSDTELTKDVLQSIANILQNMCVFWWNLKRFNHNTNPDSMILTYCFSYRWVWLSCCWDGECEYLLIFYKSWVPGRFEWDLG